MTSDKNYDLAIGFCSEARELAMPFTEIDWDQIGNEERMRAALLVKWPPNP